ncbi:MAG TPA: hypothetical protein VKU00_14205 [Chthonomonadaceae bacterium]|nr:hypothetical protein [Chthonomonadaceae bacterium]
MNPKQSIFTRMRWKALAGVMLSLACSGPGLTPSAKAQTANEISFYYKRDAGGFQDLSQLSFYGDATSSTGVNALKRQVTDPALRAQIPDTITNILVTPAAVNSVQRWSGAMYYSQPLDLRQGFRTKFFVSTNGGNLSFLIRNINETRPLISSQTDNTGFAGLANSVAVELSPAQQLAFLYIPNPHGVLGGGYVQAGGQVPYDSKTHGLLGTAIIQYIPRDQVLELYFEDMFSGERKRVFQATNIDLEKLGVLTNGKAMLGFVGVNPAPKTGSYSTISLQSWEFGSAVSQQGITSTSYSDRMVFQTNAPVSVWNPSQDPTGIFEQAYSASDQGVINSSSHSGPFSAGFNGNWDGNVGLRFKATAKNGSVNIRYPLFLDMLFPPQASVTRGSAFTIQAAYETDALAGFATQSPVYGLKASTWFGFNFGSSLFMDLAFKNFHWNLPGIHVNMGETEFFDYDTAAQAFGASTNAGGAIQDGKYIAQGANSARGLLGGVITGAGRNSNPMNYIQVLLNKPNLAASGYVDIFNDSKPTLLTGTAQSDFVGLSADFTSALLNMYGLDKAVNQDFSFNLGAGNKYAFGWNIADLYGELLTTVDMTHSFQPRPYLVLRLDELDPVTGSITNTNYVQMMLDQDGKPTSSPAITMSDKPLCVTPLVYLSNPRNGSSPITPGDPTLPTTTASFNLFHTDANLNLNGRVQFNPFSLYATGTGIPDINAQPALYTLFNQSGPIASRTSGDFEINSFQPAIGKSYYFYPAGSVAPVVDAATPSSIVAPSDPKGLTYVQLTTKLAGANVAVYLDGTVLGGEVDVKDDIIHFGIPNTLLSSRAVHQIAVMSNPNTNYKRVSNTVTLEVSAPIPAITTISPSLVTLYEKPVAGTVANGPTILQTGPDGQEYFPLTVKGAGFASEGRDVDGSLRFPQSVIAWNGLELPTTWKDANTLITNVPRSLIALAGTSKVTVRTSGAGGGESNVALFSANNPKPTLTSISASLIRADVPTSLIVKGHDFVRGSQVQLLWSAGQSIHFTSLPTRFASSGELTATIAPNSLGTNTYTVSVINPTPQGFVASTGTGRLIVDADAPVTTATLSGTTKDWQTFQGSVSISIKATDVGLSGVDKTYLEVDNLAVDGDGAPIVVTGVTTLTQPGTYTLRYYSVDKVGNEEQPHTITITLVAP